MAQGYQNNDQHRRYNERLAKLEERSVLALNSRKKKRRPRLKKKIPKVKHLQRRTNLRRVLSIVLPFGLIMAFAIYLISPLARITTVTVSGNRHLTSQQVEAATKVKPGRLIWATLPMSKQRLARIQGRNAQLKSVQISLTGLQSVKITVKEYGIIGLIKTNGKQKLLLSNGQVQPVSGNTLDQYITYGGFSGHQAMLKQTAGNIAKLSPAVRNGISEVTNHPRFGAAQAFDERRQHRLRQGQQARQPDELLPVNRGQHQRQPDYQPRIWGLLVQVQRQGRTK